MTPFITRACLAASAVLCFAIEPASAQYNIFNSQSGLVTDVIVNGIRMPLDYVEQFEQRCDIGISAGRWWRDNNGNLGREGGPALYNVNSCQNLVQRRNAPTPTQGRCSFFAGGSICSGAGWGTVNSR